MTVFKAFDEPAGDNGFPMLAAGVSARPAWMTTPPGCLGRQ